MSRGFSQIPRNKTAGRAPVPYAPDLFISGLGASLAGVRIHIPLGRPVVVLRAVRIGLSVAINVGATPCCVALDVVNSASVGVGATTVSAPM